MNQFQSQPQLSSSLPHTTQPSYHTRDGIPFATFRVYQDFHHYHWRKSHGKEDIYARQCHGIEGKPQQYVFSTNYPSSIPLSPHQYIPNRLPSFKRTEDPNPEEFDKHKQDSLAKQRAGKGHWKPELASQSEENVKADRMGPGEASEAAMKRLQDRTKEAAEETSKHGTSMRDGL